jgi:polyisoprenoid-binding protein YceI
MTIRIFSLVALALPLLAAQQEGGKEKYLIGHHPKFVNISFESQADIETILGTTNQASGEVTFDPDSGSGSVSIAVPVASLKTGIDLRDEHLRSEMWLDAKKFPQITFVSKRTQKAAEGVQVTGEFTLHGVSHEITVPVQWKRIPPDLAKKGGFPEGKWVRFKSDFSIKLSDFGVKVPEGAAGKVSDTWKVQLSIFASTAQPQGKSGRARRGQLENRSAVKA